MNESHTHAPVGRDRGLDVNVRSGPQMLEYEHIADRIAAEGLVGPVLDWGCGWGQVTDLLRRRGLETESYDYHEGEPLHKVELRYGGTAQVSGEPVALPYPDAHFSAVLSCGVLEHVQDPDASLDELHRILKPAGRLFVYKLPNRRSYLEAIARLVGMYHHGALPFDRLYDLAEARRIVSAHRFAVEEVRLTNVLPLTLSHPLAHRYAQRIWQANRGLQRTPINRFATNVEVIATAL